jgi:hypothetical protein
MNIRDLIPLRTERQCKACLKIGTIVGLEPYTSKLHVHRKCTTDGCENNFDHNNGKEWSEVKPYDEYSSSELKEILHWIAGQKDVVYRFEGKKVVVGWDGDKPWRFQRLDQNIKDNPADYMPQKEYAIRRIEEVLNEADARVSKLSDAKLSLDNITKR